MCVVSMVSDHFNDKWKDRWDQILPVLPAKPLSPDKTSPSIFITRQEFDELKREVLEMKELLKKAIEYDKRTGQPDCQMEEKIALLRRVADLVGVNLDEVFGRE